VIPLATQSARTLGYTRTTLYGVTGTRSMLDFGDFYDWVVIRSLSFSPKQWSLRTSGPSLSHVKRTCGFRPREHVSQGVLVIFSILHHLGEIKKNYLNMAPAPAFALALLERSPGSTRGAGVPN
jgi:hypothetical protein